MMRRLILLLGLLGVGACTQPRYDNLDVRAAAGDLDRASVTSRRTVLEHGRVVVIFVEPDSVGEPPYEGLEHLELRSVDPDVVGVRRGVLRDSFVLTGRSPGSTRLEVIIDDELQDTYEVDILAREEDGQ